MGRLVLALTLAVVLAATAIACGGDATDDATGASPMESPSETASATGSGDDDGARVYADNCAGCHGADGNGGVSIAGEDDAAEIRNVVESGAEGMPGYSESLTAAEIEAVAEYVAGGLQ